MSENVKVAGEKIVLAGTEYVMPPLPLVKMSSVKKLMDGGDFMSDEGYVEAMVNAVHFSLQRNYPDVERTVVSDNLDMTNFKKILDAFMTVNGFAKKEVESGEATASQ